MEHQLYRRLDFYKGMITSLISMKGGTAKTTTAVNLSAYLALAGHRVLLIDLDPQNFATICLGVDAEGLKTSVSDVLLDGQSCSETIHPTSVPHLDLIPSDRRLGSPHVLLAEVPARGKKPTKKM